MIEVDNTEYITRNDIDTMSFTGYGSDSYRYGGVSLRYQRKPTAQGIII